MLAAIKDYKNRVIGTTGAPTKQTFRFQVDSPYQFSFGTCRKASSVVILVDNGVKLLFNDECLKEN